MLANHCDHSAAATRRSPLKPRVGKDQISAQSDGNPSESRGESTCCRSAQTDVESSAALFRTRLRRELLAPRLMSDSESGVSPRWPTLDSQRTMASLECSMPTRSSPARNMIAGFSRLLRRMQIPSAPVLRRPARPSTRDSTGESTINGRPASQSLSRVGSSLIN